MSRGTNVRENFSRGDGKRYMMVHVLNKIDVGRKGRVPEGVQSTNKYFPRFHFEKSPPILTLEPHCTSNVGFQVNAGGLIEVYAHDGTVL